MNHISAIQEVIDISREGILSGQVKLAQDSCQALYKIHKSLYKLTWTIVDSHAHVVQDEDEPAFAEVKLSHKTQTLIVEAVEDLPDRPDGCGGKMTSIDMPNHGMMLKSWVELSKPMFLKHNDIFIYGREDYMVIIHSIEPYQPNKRLREE
jgi:hypothetical protein